MTNLGNTLWEVQPRILVPYYWNKRDEYFSILRDVLVPLAIKALIFG